MFVCPSLLVGGLVKHTKESSNASQGCGAGLHTVFPLSVPTEVGEGDSEGAPELLSCCGSDSTPFLLSSSHLPIGGGREYCTTEILLGTK